MKVIIDTYIKEEEDGKGINFDDFKSVIQPFLAK
jgi:hypothetical protein